MCELNNYSLSVYDFDSYYTVMSVIQSFMLLFILHYVFDMFELFVYYFWHYKFDVFMITWLCLIYFNMYLYVNGIILSM